jgi:hypothetical protein
MVERARDGTSINLQEPSDLERRTNQSLLILQVKIARFYTLAPTQDGGNNSNTKVDTSQTDRTIGFFPSRIERMKKLNQFML